MGQEKNLCGKHHKIFQLLAGVENHSFKSSAFMEILITASILKFDIFIQSSKTLKNRVISTLGLHTQNVEAKDTVKYKAECPKV